MRWKNGKSIAIMNLLLLLMICGIYACADLVKESDNKSAVCDDDLNSREYADAITSCSDDKEKLAAAYMGLAGFDIANLLNSSAKPTKAITTANVVATLGTDTVTYANAGLDVLGLNANQIPDKTVRLKAIQDAKINLDKAIDVLSPLSATELSVDGIILEILASVYSLQLELVMLLDVGKAASIDPTTQTTTQMLTTLVAANGSIELTTLTDGSAIPANTLVAQDGHLWTKEQNFAMLPNVIGIYTIGGNLAQVCASIVANKSSTTTPCTRSLKALLISTATAVGKFGSALSGSDTLTSLQAGIDTANSSNTSMTAACATFAVVGSNSC